MSTSAAPDTLALPPKPVVLEIKLKGAWMSMFQFDAETQGDAVQVHAPPLAEAVGGTLRIRMARWPLSTLLNWTPKTGWRVA